MFIKIIKLENVKQWRQTKALEVAFKKLNLIYGINGSGKSTLGQLFEYINAKDINRINTLSPIENESTPNFQFQFEGSIIKQNSLDELAVKFHVYNQSFIDKNLYSTKGVESSQLVNYYDFCLGSVAVTHQRKIDKLKVENEGLANKIKPLSSKIRAKFDDKTISQVKKIKKVPDAGKELEILNNSLTDIRNTEHFKKRKKLEKLSFKKPELDTSCYLISIEQLSKEAQDKVEKHIKGNLKERDTGWLEDGLQLVTDRNQCPFCAQSLSSSPIFHLYQDFINESYLMASKDFEIKSGAFELDVMGVGIILEELEEKVKRNNEIIREWADRLNSITLEFDFKVLNTLGKEIYSLCRELTKSKEKDLLKVIDLTPFNDLIDKLFKLIEFTDYNSRVDEFNHLIQEFIDGLGTLTSQSIQVEIESINKSEERYKPEFLNSLDEYTNLENERKENTLKINELRGRVSLEQEESIGKHKDSINRLLKNFNSMIRIGELNKDNSGYKGATRITYIITFINKKLSVLNDNKKIFDHVLSVGDKSALALSFFLSKFTQVNNDDSIIVLDDPMSSLDIHRRNATIIEIANLIKSKYQTFILSHDPFFLSDILKHSILSKDTKCYEIEVSYNDDDPYDEHSAQHCTSKMVPRNNFESYVLHSYQKEYNRLKDFVVSATEEKKIEVARSIRPIIEAYMRFLYPTQFKQDTWLGGMISKIRSEEDTRSVFFDKDNRLDSISKLNEFSKAFHHSEGFDTKIQDLDVPTVKNYAKETLVFITGL